MFEEYTMTEMERLNIWYAEQQELYVGHKEALYMLDEIYNAKKAKLIDKHQKDEVKGAKKHYKTMGSESAAFLNLLEKLNIGSLSKGLSLVQQAASSQSMMDALAGAARALREHPWPASIAIAAKVLAQGVGWTGLIKGVSAVVAHGGLDYVPKEQTYLLDKGERVLSPNQNKELMDFIRNEQGGSVQIENITIQTQENLANVDWERLTEDKLLPQFRKLASYGIRI